MTHVLVKPGGSRCNLDCTYCFYLEKEKLVRPGAMSDQVLETLVQQRLAASDDQEVEFTWQGGEPTLLGLDFFARAVEVQRRYGEGRLVRNAIQTNGVLLDDAWGEFLAANHFLVGFSVDGPEAMHDAYRVDRGGRPSFARVMRGLEILQKHRVEFNTLTVVHRANGDQPGEVYDFLCQVGSRFMQFIPLVERFAAQSTAEGLERSVGEGDGVVSERSVLPEQWGHFLCGVFDRWLERDLGERFLQVVEVALQNYLGVPPSLCLFRENCGEAVALEHNGDLYSCDHYVFPEHRLGNILKRPLSLLLRLPQQKHFGRQKSETLPQYCRKCEVLGACRGECPKNRFLKTPDGEGGLNYLCAGYKRFFLHIQPALAQISGLLAQGKDLKTFFNPTA